MNDNIDLTQNPDSAEVPGSSIEPYHPEVTLEHPDLVNLPNTGRSVIEHEVVSRTHEKKRQGGHTHRVRLKIKSIRPMGRKKTSTSNRPHLAENAMRDLM